MVPYSFFMLCNMADAMKLWILIGPYAKCLGDWLTEVDNILAGLAYKGWQKARCYTVQSQGVHLCKLTRP